MLSRSLCPVSTGGGGLSTKLLLRDCRHPKNSGVVVHNAPARQGGKCCGKKQHRHQRRSLNPVCTAGASGMWPLDAAGGDARTAVRQVLSFIR